MVRLYAAGDKAVAVVDDGKVETELEGRGARCLAVDPEDPDTLYAGTPDEGPLPTADGGGARGAGRPVPGRRSRRPGHSVRRYLGRGPLQERRRRGELGEALRRRTPQG